MVAHNEFDISEYPQRHRSVDVIDQEIFDTSNINERVYELLKRRIMSFVYTPGSKVDLRQIEDELKVSQTPIKHALSRLAVEGLVEVNPRRGTYVKTVTEKDLIEIFDVRIIIEPSAGEMVAKGKNPEKIGKIRMRYEATLELDANANYNEFIERSRLFDREIVRATDNSRLIRFYEQLNAHMQMLLFRFPRQTLGRRDLATKEHEEIVAALESNPLKARRLMRDHLVKTKKFYLKAYGARESFLK